MVFTAGCSDDNMPSSQVEIELDGGMDESKKGVEAAMESVIAEVKASKTQLGEVVALTALKISKASLKHIDPKLRSQKTRNEEGSISNSNLAMDNMIQELEPQTNP